MSEEIRKRMEAYRVKKEQLAREQDNALETIRWHVTKQLLAEYPQLKPEWLSVEDNPECLLELRLRVEGYGISKKFVWRDIENPQLSIAHTVAEISKLVGRASIQHLFD